MYNESTSSCGCQLKISEKQEVQSKGVKNCHQSNQYISDNIIRVEIFLSLSFQNPWKVGKQILQMSRPKRHHLSLCN